MRPRPLFPTEGTLGIHTDLYELTMAAAYFESGHHEQRACFELSTRRLPPGRGFLLAAGLEQALHLVERLRFEDQALDYLRGLEVFASTPPSFFEYLRGLRFSGEIHAVPEGTAFFQNEPILRVTAPVVEAQLLETYLISTLDFQTTVASKAARICLAAEGRVVVDFGSRRAHGPQAGLLAARAAFIGGCAGTSNLLAGYQTGMPVYGTMAHSFIQFFDQEEEAFRRFRDAFPRASILLIDTYDSLAGARKCLSLGGVQGLRLDSGDLLELSLRVRRLLDEAGRKEVKLFASGDLDERKIRGLVLAGAPIDAYGVGTRLAVSADAPGCDMVYKLVALEREGRMEPRLKTSPGKEILPYPKQIFRSLDESGFRGDRVCRWDEEPPAGDPSSALLQPCVEAGRPVLELPPLAAIRERAREQISRLPAPVRYLHDAERYPVEFSPALRDNLVRKA